jgi:hypothetical protein
MIESINSNNNLLKNQGSKFEANLSDLINNLEPHLDTIKNIINYLLKNKKMLEEILTQIIFEIKENPDNFKKLLNKRIPDIIDSLLDNVGQLSLGAKGKKRKKKKQTKKKQTKKKQTKKKQRHNGGSDTDVSQARKTIAARDRERKIKMELNNIHIKKTMNNSLKKLRTLEGAEEAIQKLQTLNQARVDRNNLYYKFCMFIVIIFGLLFVKIEFFTVYPVAFIVSFLLLYINFFMKNAKALSKKEWIAIAGKKIIQQGYTKLTYNINPDDTFR